MMSPQSLPMFMARPRNKSLKLALGRPRSPCSVRKVLPQRVFMIGHQSPRATRGSAAVRIATANEILVKSDEFCPSSIYPMEAGSHVTSEELQRVIPSPSLDAARLRWPPTAPTLSTSCRRPPAPMSCSQSHFLSLVEYRYLFKKRHLKIVT